MIELMNEEETDKMKKKKDFNNDTINPYEVDKLSKIPSWIVILFLKYWAAAAAVFFMIIGGTDIGLNFAEVDTNTSDIMQVVRIDAVIIFAIAFAIAILFTYAIRPIVRLMYNRRNNTFKYNMVNGKGFLPLIFNMVYMYIISFILFFVVIFLGSKGLVVNLFGEVSYGIEPFSYGLYFIILDSFFIFIKNSIVAISQRITYKRQIKEA